MDSVAAPHRSSLFGRSRTLGRTLAVLLFLAAHGCRKTDLDRPSEPPLVAASARAPEPDDHEFGNAELGELSWLDSAEPSQPSSELGAKVLSSTTSFRSPHPTAAELQSSSSGSASLVGPVSESDASSSEPRPLPSGTTVLHIGDSFAGALGIALNAELKAAGVHSILHFKVASFIPDWAFGKDVPFYVSSFHPDLVLITLGANEVAMFDPTQRAGTIRRLVKRLEGRPCVWIAPPLWAAGDRGLLPVIRANCAPCRYMDSNAVYPEMPRLPDKIHPSIPARTEWAKRVVAWLARERRPTPGRPWELAEEPPAQ